MTRNVSYCAALLFSLGSVAFSQATSVMVGAGYAAPEPPQIAPGQVVTLYYRAVVPGAGGQPRSGQARAPLPSLLAGLSAQIVQGTSLFHVPLMEVRQQNTCDGDLTGPACVLTSVKVQIPFEIAADVTQDRPAGPVTLSPIANLALYADGQVVASTPLQPVPDNAHVLTDCDLGEHSQTDTACGRAAFHQDGTRVNAGTPAARAETIRVPLYGLGQTSPAATTGDAAQPGHVVTDVMGTPRVRVSFLPFGNALASAPRHAYLPDANEVPGVIAGATLRGGDVGIYELATTVPESLSPPLVCGGSIRSNYILNVITSQGVEIVPICVAP